MNLDGRWQVAASHLSNDNSESADPKVGTTGPKARAQRLAGNWTGGFWLDGSWVGINLRFDDSAADRGRTADVVFPTYGGAENAINAPMTEVRLTTSGFHVEILTPKQHKVQLDGQEKNDTIAGQFAYNNSTGTFGLTRVAAVTPGIP